MALICVGAVEITPTRSTNGGLKPLLMEVGTANMAGVLTSAIITFSGSCGTDAAAAGAFGGVAIAPAQPAAHPVGVAVVSGDHPS